MATASAVRFSNDKVGESKSAQTFGWENPVPRNRFWDSISYSTGRCFLGNFSDEELAQLPIDPDSAAPNDEKFELLLRLQQEQLAAEEAAVAPQPLQQVNPARWFSLYRAIEVLQSELGRLADAERTIRMIVDGRPGDNHALHILAGHLVKVGVGKYAEAEEVERPVLAEMVARPTLGPDSPQAINARRFLAKALWGQGPSRRAEAEAEVAEIKAIVDRMGEGRFGVYQDSEREINEQMMADMERMDKQQ